MGGVQLENEALVLDLLEWVGQGDRSYQAVMDAWRTSCPRLTIWEDALELGFVARTRADDGHAAVVLTEAGAALLKSHGRLANDINR